MRLVVASIRPARSAWADAACAEWGKRIRRHFPFEEVAVDVVEVPARGLLVVMDERGEDLTSEQFAALLDAAARQSATAIVFAIGGPFGHTDATRERAWRTVRLSRLVLAHAVARVVLVEQVYRACAIRTGAPYHHG